MERGGHRATESYIGETQSVTERLVRSACEAERATESYIGETQSVRKGWLGAPVRRRESYIGETQSVTERLVRSACEVESRTARGGERATSVRPSLLLKGWLGAPVRSRTARGGERATESYIGETQSVSDISQRRSYTLRANGGNVNPNQRLVRQDHVTNSVLCAPALPPPPPPHPADLHLYIQRLCVTKYINRTSRHCVRIICILLIPSFCKYEPAGTHLKMYD